jgi:phosphomannomutase
MLSISGCRGIMGKTITAEVAARFAGVFGSWVRERHGESGRPLVVVGRDGRAGGEVLLAAAAAGLAGAGCDVLTIDVAMTPTVAVMVDARGADAGLVITASHNPQEWNGLKMLIRSGSGPSARAGAVDACAPGKGEADEILARYSLARERGVEGVGYGAVGSIAAAPEGGLNLPSESTHAHLFKVRQALKEVGAHDDRRSMGIRVVVDSVNASGRQPAAALLGGRLVHHLGAGVNGLFPHPPEPTRENLASLCRFVAEKRADVGFAQDPDADRLAIVDENGVYIGEEYTLVFAAEAILGRLTGSAPRSPSPAPVVVTNLSTSRMIEDVAAKYGARVVRTPVGEANVVSRMKAEGAVLGGEGNGGVIWPRVTYVRDSLSAMGLVLGLMSRTQKTISQLVREIPAYSIIKRKVDVRTPDDGRHAVEAVSRAFANSGRIDLQDGVRVDFEADRSWLHVRASNTEPILRLIAEAPTEIESLRILDDASRAIA